MRAVVSAARAAASTRAFTMCWALCLILNPPADAAESLSTEIPTRPAELESVIVTAHPIPGTEDELAAPAQVLTGSRLDARRAVSIGEMLSGLPGVSASAFGPNASRPIVRGLDGDRLKVLSNGVPILDASAASPDHAVAAESLLIDRVEVLRGPAALRFGGGAIGGVVNLIDGRIPEVPIESFSSQADVRQGGAAHESAGIFRLDGGNGRIAWHADALARRSSDLSIPGFSRVPVLRSAQPDAARDLSGRLPNSAANAQGMTFGIARTEAEGFFGLALSQTSQRYGTTLFEDGVPIAIDLVQTRLNLSARQSGVAGGTLSIAGALSQYRHAELAGDVVGTEFRHQGGDGRIEWNRQLGPARWVIGGQWGTQTLRVTGEEAFLPVNRGEQSALYALVDRTLVKSLRVEAGGRIERVSMRSEAGPIRVDAVDRQFSLRNFSTGAVWSASPTTTLTAHLSHSERAPNAQELLADGVHTATATYEVGDPSLKPEQSNGWNLGLRQSVGPLRLRLDIFEQRFNRFISLRSTGETYHPIDGESTAIAAFGSGAAQSRGAEIDFTWTAWERGAKRLNLEGGYDQVRLTDQTGAPLPRIPAQRWRWAAAWRDGNLSARLEALSARRVSRVAIEETPTPGWTRIDAWLGWTLAPNWQVQLTGRNLTNAVIRDHTSFLKDSSIAGGRSVLLSLRFQQ